VRFPPAPETVAPLTGVLFLVPTPIGNLEDITLRALAVLREADLIACEDTRHTRKLLSRYDIHVPTTSYHAHNQRLKGEYLLQKLAAGKKIAMVSDAGQPGVSDPGSRLVAQALAGGFRVKALPGPSAALTALAVSGLPTERFVFEGFLPPSGRARKERLQALAREERTVILYEAPHHLMRTLADLAAIMPGRKMAAARELTKQFEEVVRGSVEEVRDRFTVCAPRGEFTLVLAGCPPVREVGKAGEADITALYARLVAGGLDRKGALKETASRLGLARREVYAAVAGRGEGGGKAKDPTAGHGPGDH